MARATEGAALLDPDLMFGVKAGLEQQRVDQVTASACWPSAAQRHATEPCHYKCR